MIEIVEEFVVGDEARGRFELAYGPGGAWSKLFGPSQGFRGTMLMRDIESPGRYLSIEVWDTLEEREQARTEREVAFSDLQADLSDWCESRVEVGVFRVMAEGTVRPRGRARRRGRR